MGAYIGVCILYSGILYCLKSVDDLEFEGCVEFEGCPRVCLSIVVRPSSVVPLVPSSALSLKLLAFLVSCNKGIVWCALSFHQ